MKKVALYVLSICVSLSACVKEGKGIEEKIPDLVDYDRYVSMQSIDDNLLIASGKKVVHFNINNGRLNHIETIVFEYPIVEFDKVGDYILVNSGGYPTLYQFDSNGNISKKLEEAYWWHYSACQVITIGGHLYAIIPSGSRECSDNNSYYTARVVIYNKDPAEESSLKRLYDLEPKILAEANGNLIVYSNTRLKVINVDDIEYTYRTDIIPSANVIDMRSSEDRILLNGYNYVSLFTVDSLGKLNQEFYKSL